MTKKVKAEKNVEVAPLKKEIEVKEPQAPKWEIKDRSYYLLADGEPLTYVLQSKSSKRKPLL